MRPMVLVGALVVLLIFVALLGAYYAPQDVQDPPDPTIEEPTTEPTVEEKPVAPPMGATGAEKTLADTGGPR